MNQNDDKSSTKEKGTSLNPGYGQILLRNQLKELIKNPVDGFSIGLEDDSNIYKWRVVIEGPVGTML